MCAPGSMATALPQDHRHAACRPQSYSLHWHDLMIFLELEGKRAHKMGKNDRRLVHGKERADTDTGSRTKGQISKSIDPLARTWQESARIEPVWVFPQQMVPV